MIFAIGITLYYPTDDDLQNLTALTDCADALYVFDNTEGKDERLIELPQSEKIHYRRDISNAGLSVAYNDMCARALSDGVDYLLILDQDSRIGKSDIDTVIGVIENDDRSDIAQYCCTVLYGKRREEAVKQEDGFCQWAINSGSFLNLKLLSEKQIFYDENYFVDRLDQDHCRQIRRKGLRIWRVGSAFLVQRLGETGANGHTGHSPIRHYYIARDRLYFNAKFLSAPKRHAVGMLQTLRHAYRIVRNEDRKWEKLKMCARGISDYRKKRHGKIPESK